MAEFAQDVWLSLAILVGLLIWFTIIGFVVLEVSGLYSDLKEKQDTNQQEDDS